MENYINILIAILQHLDQLTEAEAKRLADHIKVSTIPATYDEVQRLVKTILDRAKNPVKLASDDVLKAAGVTPKAKNTK